MFLSCGVRTLESSLERKEINPVKPKVNQCWIFIRRIDAEAEAPILWPPDEKNWLTGKDPDAGKDGRQKNGMTEDEMVGWHHLLDGHEFEQDSGGGGGQGSLVCCSPCGHKESDTTERLNWTEWFGKNWKCIKIHTFLVFSWRLKKHQCHKICSKNTNVLVGEGVQFQVLN